MKPALRRLLLILLVGWLERVIWLHGASTGFMPDLLLILLVAWLPQLSRYEGVAWGFVCGLFQDMAAPGVAGLLALSKALGAFAAGWLPRGPFSNKAVWMALGLLTAGGVQTGVTLLFSRSHWAEGLLNATLRYGLPRLASTWVLGVVLAWVAGWVRTRRGRR